MDLIVRAMGGGGGVSDDRGVQGLTAGVRARLLPHNGGAALARCITDNGALIIGQTRGCNGAAPLKAWSTAGHTCASFLAEGMSKLNCEEWLRRDDFSCCSCVKGFCAARCVGQHQTRRDGGAHG